MRTRITCCKNGMLRDEEVRAIEMDGVDFPAVYFGYREYLERNRRMDYDDQMVFALRILRRYPDILAHFQSKYPYLCVDEAQDKMCIRDRARRPGAPPPCRAGSPSPTPPPRRRQAPPGPCPESRASGTPTPACPRCV